MNDDEIFMDRKTILVKLHLKPSENIKEQFDLLGNALIYTYEKIDTTLVSVR